VYLAWFRNYKNEGKSRQNQLLGNFTCMQQIKVSVIKLIWFFLPGSKQCIKKGKKALSFSEELKFASYKSSHAISYW
jgi:hypothetical protein